MYVLWLWLLIAFVSLLYLHTHGEGPTMFIMFTVIPCSIFLFLSIAEIPLIVLKLDGNLDARWAVVLVPYWIGLVVNACGFCLLWSFSSCDLIRHRRGDQSPEAETGKIFNRALLGLVFVSSSTAFLVMLCEREDEVNNYSAFQISGAIWGAWVCWFGIYALDYVFDLLFRTRNCYNEIATRYRQQQLEDKEVISREVLYEQAHRDFHGVEKSRSFSLVKICTLSSSTNNIKNTDVGDPIGKKDDEGVCVDGEISDELTRRISQLERAHGERRILSQLVRIHNIVSAFPILITHENRRRLVEAVQYIRQYDEKEWTRDVAQMFGHIIRRFTTLGDIIRRREPMMRSIRSVRDRGVPEPPLAFSSDASAHY